MACAVVPNSIGMLALKPSWSLCLNSGAVSGVEPESSSGLAEDVLGVNWFDLAVGI